MATIAAVGAESHDQFTPGHALRFAWLSWLVLLAIPALMFLVVLWMIMGSEHGPRGGLIGEQWFIGCMIYLAVAVPLAFFARSRLFRNYWAGHVVAPRNYIKGMLIVWVSLEVGGLLSLTGCLVSNSLTPCILPALVAFMLFTPFWPSGRAMTNPVGNDDDFEVYEEPR